MADPVRYQLLFQRTIPDFVPSDASMALARASYADMAGVLARLGIVDAADLDLWTAVQMGLADQQLANEPGGDRWTSQLDRAIDMFLAHARHPARRRSYRTWQDCGPHRGHRAAERPPHTVAPVVWRNGLLADASVDPLTQQVGVTGVAGVLVDHLDQHLAQRDRSCLR